jgi:hypothetical protein
VRWHACSRKRNDGRNLRRDLCYYAINQPTFSRTSAPDSARIETSTREWITRFGLGRSDAGTEGLVQSRFGEAAAYGYPDAPLPVAELAAGWFAWLFFNDDHHEEGPHGSTQNWADVTEAVRGTLETGEAAGPLADTPLIRALADLSYRFDALASPAWKRRFARHLMDVMTGGLRDIQLRDGGTPLPLVEYIPLRRDASAVLTCFDVIEVCAHAELPDHVYRSPALQEIILAGADLFSWINDLYSLDKEIACGIVSNLGKRPPRGRAAAARADRHPATRCRHPAHGAPLRGRHPRLHRRVQRVACPRHPPLPPTGRRAQ